MGQGNCSFYYKCCFILLVSTISCLLKSTALTVLIDLFQFKIILVDSSTGSSFYLQYGGLFIKSSLYFKALFW
jgi:drug/metabolite transporter superfamily protein YnfA